MLRRPVLVSLVLVLASLAAIAATTASSSLPDPGAVMDPFMPPGDLPRVEAAADQLVALVSASMVDVSTLYMPVTRELSAGKRLILETWGNLVIRKYPQQDLSPIAVPCDV